jgi:hypothetical protein
MQCGQQAHPEGLSAEISKKLSNPRSNSLSLRENFIFTNEK